MNTYSLRKYNHRKINRIYRFRISLSLIVSLVLLFIILGGNAKASDVNSTQYKYFHVVTIEAGDTLWNLASESGYINQNDFIKEVKKINHLSSDKLIDGQSIVIPYYSNEFMK